MSGPFASASPAGQGRLNRSVNSGADHVLPARGIELHKGKLSLDPSRIARLFSGTRFGLRADDR